MSSTLYEVIGVAPDAARKTLAQAYRTLARELHPDVNPDPAARQRMAQVNDAYATLSDSRRRSAYNTSLGLSPAPTIDGSQKKPVTRTTPPAPQTDESTQVRVVLDPHGRRGPDLVVDLTLSPAEVATGGTREISTPYYRACGACHGTGYSASGPLLSCAVCSGLGMDAISGTACSTCQGRGAVSQHQCDRCAGARATLDTYATTITVPSGLRPGAVVSRTGHGLPGLPGLPLGDLSIRVQVDLPDFFVQSGGAVGLDVPLHYAELRAGATLTVPGITGPVPLVVPAGTPPGTVLVAEGGGYPDGTGCPGPLHVRCDLWNPASSSDEVTTALAALLEAEQHDSDIRAHLQI